MRIAERRVFHSERDRRRIHLGHERIDGARDMLGERDRRIVTGLDQ